MTQTGTTGHQPIKPIQRTMSAEALAWAIADRILTERTEEGRAALGALASHLDTAVFTGFADMVGREVTNAQQG